METAAEWDGIAVDPSYKTLPMVYLAFLSIWSLLGFSWASNWWRSYNSQMKNLQLVLGSVTLIKAMQLTSSFLFWYSCVDLKICSLWMSFGAYVSGIMFQTLSFVSFTLISHGYCITCARLSASERRRTAVLALVLYLALVGYKAGLPYCNVILMVSYLTSFCIIFARVSRNLVKLKEQMRSIEDEGVDPMQDVLRSKYTMFKKFRSTMQILVLTKFIIHLQLVDLSDYHWFIIFFREWTSLCIFLYISWTFRSRQLPSHFWVSQSLMSKPNRILPPIYTIVSSFIYLESRSGENVSHYGTAFYNDPPYNSSKYKGGSVQNVFIYLFVYKEFERKSCEICENESIYFENIAGNGFFRLQTSNFSSMAGWSSHFSPFF